MLIDIDKIDFSEQGNQRTRYDATALAELAASIREQGQIEPIVVRTKPSGRYELMAGHRRFLAMQMNGSAQIDATVNDDADPSLVMLTENIMREDLDPIDEAGAYRRVMDEKGITADELAAKVGISAQIINNRLPLLTLIPDGQELVRSGQLSVGYAKALADAGLDTNRQRIALAALRDQGRPTLTWFRQVVAKLLMDQAQESLFAMPLYDGELATALPPMTLPPDPTKDKPVAKSSGVTSVLAEHVAFWLDAADQWLAMGRPAKARECRAAASAIENVLSAFKRDSLRL